MNTPNNTHDLQAWFAKTFAFLAFLVLIFFAIAAMITGARSEECFRSDAAVRAAYGEKVWSAYTTHMDGHKGNLCYYPSVKGNPKVHLHLARKQTPYEALVARAEVTPSPKAAPRPHFTVVRHETKDELAIITAPASSRFFGNGYRSIRFLDALPKQTAAEMPARSIWTAWTHDGWCDEAFLLTNRGVEWPLL